MWSLGRPAWNQKVVKEHLFIGTVPHFNSMCIVSYIKTVKCILQLWMSCGESMTFKALEKTWLFDDTYEYVLLVLHPSLGMLNPGCFWGFCTDICRLVSLHGHRKFQPDSFYLYLQCIEVLHLLSTKIPNFFQTNLFHNCHTTFKRYDILKNLDVITTAVFINAPRLSGEQ